MLAGYEQDCLCTVYSVTSRHHYVTSYALGRIDVGRLTLHQNINANIATNCDHTWHKHNVRPSRLNVSGCRQRRGVLLSRSPTAHTIAVAESLTHSSPASVASARAIWNRCSRCSPCSRCSTCLWTLPTCLRIRCGCEFLQRGTVELYVFVAAAFPTVCRPYPHLQPRRGLTVTH